jgi:hypothetical protein
MGKISPGNLEQKVAAIAPMPQSILIYIPNFVQEIKGEGEVFPSVLLPQAFFDQPLRSSMSPGYITASWPRSRVRMRMASSTG